MRAGAAKGSRCRFAPRQARIRPPACSAASTPALRTTSSPSTRPPRVKGVAQAAAIPRLVRGGMQVIAAQCQPPVRGAPIRARPRSGPSPTARRAAVVSSARRARCDCRTGPLTITRRMRRPGWMPSCSSVNGPAASSRGPMSAPSRTPPPCPGGKSFFFFVPAGCLRQRIASVVSPAVDDPQARLAEQPGHLVVGSPGRFQVRGRRPAAAAAARRDPRRPAGTA